MMQMGNFSLKLPLEPGALLKGIGVVLIYENVRYSMGFFMTDKVPW